MSCIIILRRQKRTVAHYCAIQWLYIQDTTRRPQQGEHNKARSSMGLLTDSLSIRVNAIVSGTGFNWRNLETRIWRDRGIRNQSIMGFVWYTGALCIEKSDMGYSSLNGESIVVIDTNYKRIREERGGGAGRKERRTRRRRTTVMTSQHLTISFQHDAVVSAFRIFYSEWYSSSG